MSRPEIAGGDKFQRVDLAERATGHGHNFAERNLPLVAVGEDDDLAGGQREVNFAHLDAHGVGQLALGAGPVARGFQRAFESLRRVFSYD